MYRAINKNQDVVASIRIRDAIKRIVGNRECASVTIFSQNPDFVGRSHRVDFQLDGMLRPKSLFGDDLSKLLVRAAEVADARESGLRKQWHSVGDASTRTTGDTTEFDPKNLPEGSRHWVEDGENYVELGGVTFKVDQ